MHRTRWIVGLCGLAWVLGGPACDGTHRPSQPADIELSSSGVVWLDGALTTRVTARALDSDGQPLAQVLIGLDASRAGVAVDPAIGTSDQAGLVEFSVSTAQGGPVDLQAVVDLAGQALGDPLEVDFKLQLGLSAGELEWTHPGGRVVVSASVADADGPLAGVGLRLSADRPADVVTPTLVESDGAGQAIFDVSSQTSGATLLSLSVDGLTLPDAPSVAVGFVGPSLSGRWSLPEPGAVLIAPRIGLLWIDVQHIADPGSDFQELTSVGLDELPALGASGAFELELPMDAPPGALYRPDPTNPDLPDSFQIATYVMGMYDDLDASGDLSDGDGLLATSDEPVLLLYAEGELPDPQVLPGGTLGYQYLVLGEADPPDLLPLADLADAHDLDIRLAPCPSGPLTGRISFGSALADGEDVRIGAILIDAQLLFSDRMDEMFDVGNFVDLASVAVPFVTDSQVDYTLELPEPGDAHPGYEDFLYPAVEGVPDFGVLAPVVYLDSDHNGVFTNDDNDLQTGDRIVGGPQLAFGYGALLVEWLDGAPAFYTGLWMPGLNQGHNLLRAPLEGEVEAVVDDQTLQLRRALEPGHTGLPFRIERNAGGLGGVVLQGDDLATSANPTTQVTSAQGGFLAAVQAGDRLVITNLLQNPELLDLDTPVDLVVP